MQRMEHTEIEGGKKTVLNPQTAEDIVKRVQEENETAPKEKVQMTIILELGKAIRRTIRLLEENPAERPVLVPVLAELGAKMRWVRQMAG